MWAIFYFNSKIFSRVHDTVHKLPISFSSTQTLTLRTTCLNTQSANSIYIQRYLKVKSLIRDLLIYLSLIYIININKRNHIIIEPTIKLIMTHKAITQRLEMMNSITILHHKIPTKYHMNQDSQVRSLSYKGPDQEKRS